MVFADSTLKLMAKLRPQTLAEFGKISGIGSHKLSQYGNRFVFEIQAYCQEYGQPVQTNPSTSVAVFPSDTQLLTLQLHRQGLSVEEIAQERGFSVSTIIDHLAELIAMNQPVDLDQLVLPVRQQFIVKAMQAVGTASLKSIYKHLQESYTYDEIRLVRAWWQCRKNS
jgi:ATP-dependent DNA helicase RecQ